MRVLNQSFGHPLDIEERGAVLLAGGIAQHGYQCGAVWGAALAAGAAAYHRWGPGVQTEARAVAAAARIVDSFRAANAHVDCLEITDIDKSSSIAKMLAYFWLKGGTIRCYRRAGRNVPTAFGHIADALSLETEELPAPPVSCAALVAARMGASELQTAMAAGLAGGIGLSGGACGALGAAAWLVGMRRCDKGDNPLDLKDPETLRRIDSFLKQSDYEFECSQIAGQRFETIHDHARYLRNGGCAAIMEAIAADG